MIGRIQIELFVLEINRQYTSKRRKKQHVKHKHTFTLLFRFISLKFCRLKKMKKINGEEKKKTNIQVEFISSRKQMCNYIFFSCTKSCANNNAHLKKEHFVFTLSFHHHHPALVINSTCFGSLHCPLVVSLFIACKHFTKEPPTKINNTTDEQISRKR